MVFWGVEVKSGKPFTLKATDATGVERLHISQATLGLGNATERSILQCNVGDKSPVFLCVLSPKSVNSCQLNLEFKEDVEVIFSVVGPRSIHLSGYFLEPSSTGFWLNDDKSESYGQDIADTDMEKGSSDDYDYNDSFINDDDPSADYVSSTEDDEISIKEMTSKTKDRRSNVKKLKRLRKKFQASNSDSIETSARADDSSNGTSWLTRWKARSSTFRNGESNAKCEKTSEAKTHTHKTLDKKEDTPLEDVELPPVQKDYAIISKKKQNNESSAVAMNLDEGEGENMPQDLQNEKPATEKINLDEGEGENMPHDLHNEKPTT